MAKVQVTKRALRDLDGLDGHTRRRIVDALQEYSRDPIQHAKKLSNTSLGTYRYRIGEYRVVFDLEHDTVVVLRIGHRREIYRG